MKNRGLIKRVWCSGALFYRKFEMNMKVYMYYLRDAKGDLAFVRKKNARLEGEVLEILGMFDICMHVCKLEYNCSAGSVLWASIINK